MSLVACACFLLRCDGCDAAFDEEREWHFPTGDPADRMLVDHAESCGWTTDGKRWHCTECPDLRQGVCRACRVGRHSLCDDPDCACMVTVGQGVLPGIGEEPPRG